MTFLVVCATRLGFSMSISPSTPLRFCCDRTRNWPLEKFKSCRTPPSPNSPSGYLTTQIYLKQNSSFAPHATGSYTILNMALFPFPSAPSHNPQQTPIYLSVKYGLNLPTLLHCHCHHPSTSHNFLSEYQPAPCFHPRHPTIHSAEKLKQSFKNKSGHLSSFRGLHQLPTTTAKPKSLQ